MIIIIPTELIERRQWLRFAYILLYNSHFIEDNIRKEYELSTGDLEDCTGGYAAVEK